jgi:hypothetical protein
MLIHEYFLVFYMYSSPVSFAVDPLEETKFILAGSGPKGAKIQIQVGKLFHHWGEVMPLRSVLISFLYRTFFYF